MRDHDQCISRYLIEYRLVVNQVLVDTQSSIGRYISQVLTDVSTDTPISRYTWWFTRTSPILHQYFTFTECIGWYWSIYQLIHWSTQKGDGLIVPIYFWNLNFVKSFPQKFHLPIQQVTSGLIHYPNWKIYSRVSDITWWCDSAQLTSNRIRWPNS